MPTLDFWLKTPWNNNIKDLSNLRIEPDTKTTEDIISPPTTRPWAVLEQKDIPLTDLDTDVSRSISELETWEVEVPPVFDITSEKTDVFERVADTIIPTAEATEPDIWQVEMFVKKGVERWLNREEIRDAYNQALAEGVFDIEAPREDLAWVSVGVEVPEEEKWFIWRVWEELWERAEQLIETEEERLAWEITMPETILRQAGSVLGWLWDVIWETWTRFLQSDVGQIWLKALWESVEAYKDFSTEHPRAAKNLEAIWNIASFVPVWAVWWRVTKVTWKAIWTTGKTLQESAKKTIKRNIDDFATELVSPIKNKKQIIDDIARGRIQEGGLFKWRTRIPTKSEISIAEEVKRVPWFWPWKTSLENNNAILNQISTLDDNLIKSLKENDVLIPRKETMSSIKWVKNRLSENPLIVWDAEKVANKLIIKFEQIVKSNPWKATWLLKSRREFDNWVK